MRDSLAFRTTLLYAVLVLLTITVFVVVVFENQVDLIARNALVNGQLAGLRLREALADRGPQALDDELMRTLGVASLAVYTGSGELKTPVYGREPDIPEQPIRINAALARHDFENRLYHHVLDYELRRIELYIPMGEASANRHVAVATFPLTEIDTQLSYLYRQAGTIAALVVIFHALYAWYLAKTVLKPLHRIVNATERVARGDFLVRVPAMAHNELGRLATAFNEMGAAVARMQNEARESNPLTGLPGNPAIVTEIERRLAEPAAVLYVDLDNFKVFNDHYGFSRGDQAILFARDCVTGVAEGYAGTFVGHEGGDDFVLVADAGHWEEIARGIIERFDAGRDTLYDESDLRRGYIEGTDRVGNTHRFPLLSVSIAVVTTEHRVFGHPGEVAGVAAEVKKRAKQDQRSSYVVDQRTGSESVT